MWVTAEDGPWGLTEVGTSMRSSGGFGHRLGLRPITFLYQQEDEYEPADHRHEPDEHPPPAPVRVVQPANGDGQVWHENSQGEEPAQLVADKRQNEADDARE